MCAGHLRRCEGKAPVRAIEALSTIQPTGSFERTLAHLLMAAYTRRLRAIVAAVPASVSDDQMLRVHC